MNDIDWTKTHCGVFCCPWEIAKTLQPELRGPLEDLVAADILEMDPWDYVVDSKIHMLMPNQYPCIPNWHYDHVPRGPDGTQDFSRCNGNKMYLWVSGPPLTEFEDGFIPARTWVEFTQRDVHRGTKSAEHCWRAFIRVAPTTILKPRASNEWLRRHSQVYLNADDFTW